ncbi:MAG: hypothetical protein IPM06_18700 [Rhizobiales bacterium]|nr:hypothetical protein [Hyphomicrobiales bacterium]
MIEELYRSVRNATPLFATTTVSWTDGTRTVRSVNLADDGAFTVLRRIIMATAARGGTFIIEPQESPMKYVVNHKGFEIEVTKEGPMSFVAWVMGEKTGEGQTVSEAERSAREAIDGMGGDE